MSQSLKHNNIEDAIKEAIISKVAELKAGAMLAGDEQVNIKPETSEQREKMKEKIENGKYNNMKAGKTMNKIEKLIIKLKERAAKKLASSKGGSLFEDDVEVNIKPETAEDRQKMMNKLKNDPKKYPSGNPVKTAGALLAGGILDTTDAVGGKRKKKAGAILIDDITEKTIGGKKMKKMAAKKIHGDGGKALSEYRDNLERFRQAHPHIPYREAQRIVARK